MARRRSGTRQAAVESPPRLEEELAALRERQAILFDALGLSGTARRGDRGTVGELKDAVIKIQDYLLRSSERVDNILGTLKNHRELLVKMNQRQFQVGTRERIRMELDIMKNTLSILALSGAEVDETLPAEIQRLRESTERGEADIASLRKSKERIDKRFDTEVRRFDLAAIYRPRAREIPGYR